MLTVKSATLLLAPAVLILTFIRSGNVLLIDRVKNESVSPLFNVRVGVINQLSLVPAPEATEDQFEAANRIPVLGGNVPAPSEPNHPPCVAAGLVELLTAV